MNDQLLTLNLIVLYVLSGGLVAMVVLYIKTLRQFEQYQKSRGGSKNPGQKQAEELFDDAQDQAAALIEAANQKAAESIKRIRLFNGATQKSFQQNLEAISQEQAAAYKKTADGMFTVYKKELGKLEENHTVMLTDVASRITREAQFEISNFKKILTRETLAGQKIVEEKIEKDYAALQKELAEYRLQRLQKIDAQIYALLGKISTLALGKSLDLSDHQELIIEALEQAKKEGVFER